jgi:hypothetical protein
MKVRKRHRLVLLFWLPFWTLTVGICAAGVWVIGLISH